MIPFIAIFFLIIIITTFFILFLTTDFAFFFLPFFVLFFNLFIIKMISDAIRRSNIHRFFKQNVVMDPFKELENLAKNCYVDVSRAELEKFHTDDLEALKNYFYNLFWQFETAYNNLDYFVMKSLSTKQLYQNYYTGIRLDLQVGKKKIVEQITRKNVIIYELDSTSIKQTLSAMIEISYISYTINHKGDILSGNRQIPVTETFEVTFRKDFAHDDSTKCPNCGAPLSGNRCEYCKTVSSNPEFKISNIKKVTIR